MTEEKLKEWQQETRPLFALVRRTAQVLRLSWIGTGSGVSLGLFFSAVVGVAVVDMLVPLGPVARTLYLLIVVLPTLAALGLGVVRSLYRELPEGHVARRIEAHIPRIHNRLVSCIDLVANWQTHHYSPAFCRRLVGETVERVRSFQPAMVVDRWGLKWSGVFAAASLAAFLVLLWIFPGRLTTALARVFVPFADIPPVSSVLYAVQPGDAKVLRGDDVTFTAKVLTGDPAKLSLEIRGDNGGRPLWYDLQKRDRGVWQFTLSGYERSFSYRVHGGGTWSKQYRTVLFERPTIVDLHTVIHYPGYMGIPEPLTNQVQVAEVTGPEGSTVDVVVQVKGDAARGELQMLEGVSNTAPGGAQAELEMRPAGTIPMTAGEAGAWVGSFRLTTNGYYRVEFKNELGYANKTMKAARFVALADNGPQITIERPGTDLVLGEGGKVPLVIAASDDYGLSDVNVQIVHNGTNYLPIKRYEAPQQSDAIVSTLDLSSLGLKLGDSIRYRAEARDRKGQSAATREFSVRIATEERAADRRLDRFEREQDLFVARLTQIMSTQAVVHASLEKLQAQYAPLIDRMEEAQAEAQLRPAPELLSDIPTNAPAAGAASNLLARTPDLKLDPENAKLLEEMRQKLGELAALEQASAAAAAQFSSEFAKSREEAGTLPMVPMQMTDQMRMMQAAIDQTAVGPMKELASEMQAESKPQGPVPEMDDLKRLGDRLDQDMANLSQNFQDMNAASDLLRENPAQAVEKLEDNSVLTQAGLVSHELRASGDVLSDMLDEMKRLQGQEEKLAEATAEEPDKKLPALEKQQAQVEKEADPLLEYAKDIQESDDLKRMKRAPAFPDAPYTPDQEQYYVPPKEEDTEEAEKAKEKKDTVEEKQKADEGDKKADEAKKEEEKPDEPLFMPALGGPEPQLDPRFADKQRPVAKTAKALSPALAERREELASREWQRVQELDLAQKSVASDQESMQSVSKQLDKAAAAARSHGANSPPKGPSLPKMMQGQALQQAMAMAARMQAAAAARSPSKGTPQQGSASMGGGLVLDRLPPENGQTPEIDAMARTVILNLQPRLREELLQGMREEGPEAYRKFIQNYFHQLTKVKSPP